MDDTPTTQPTAQPCAWDRLPEEQAADYSAFMAYMQLPAPRSARSLALATNLPARSMDRKRTKFRWAERAEAYDNHRLQEALQSAPMDLDNPYKRMLMQTAQRAQNLHDAANKLLTQATRVLDHSERMYLKDLAKNPDRVPPVPSSGVVAAIRGASEVMDRSAEAQAMALGITDVLKMQAEVGA